jgi:hypothetical protein
MRKSCYGIPGCALVAPRLRRMLRGATVSHKSTDYACYYDGGKVMTVCTSLRWSNRPY